jgi:hypothetical protein
MAERDVVRARVPARSGTKQFGVALFRWVFSQNFRTEVGKPLNTKVVDLALLYNFCKRHRVFFSTVCAQEACQVGSFLGASEQLLRTLT